MASFKILVLCMASGAVLSVSAGQKYGPVENRDGMFISFGGPGSYNCRLGEHFPKIHAKMMEIGFNTYQFTHENLWDFEKGEPLEDVPENFSNTKAFFELCERDGVSVGVRIMGIWKSNEKSLWKRYPRYNPDGTKKLDMKGSPHKFDTRNPEAIAAYAKWAEWFGRTFPSPSVVLVEPANEVFDKWTVSFTPETTNAWRAYSGKDFPKELDEYAKDKSVLRQPKAWKWVKGFPANRVVPDDYPILDFHRWAWKEGFGWAGFNDAMCAAYSKGIGRKVPGTFAPALRTPALFGACGHMGMMRSWAYVHPEPYRLASTAALLQSRTRGMDAMIIASVQGACYRSRIAPMDEKVANPPKWLEETPNTAYPTTPPDMIEEAYWASVCRRVDGVSLWGLKALVDIGKYQPMPKGYRKGKSNQCSNPETIERVGKFFHEVAIPLGPLVRAVPEREGRVAILESYASQILGHRVTWDCEGLAYEVATLATVANLMPYVMTEEEVEKTGVPENIKVILAPDCDVLTESAYRKLAAFQARGGKIVATANLCPALKIDAMLPNPGDDKVATKDDYDDGNSKKKRDADVRDASVMKAAAKLKKIVSQWVPFYADTDDGHIFAHVRSCKDADYVFAINDKRGYGDYVGQWKRVMEKGLPNAGHVTVARSAGAVYDLVRHAEVPFEVKDGNTVIPVSYATNDGRLLMVTAKPLAALSVKVEGRKVTVTSPDAGVMIPIEVKGFGRKPFYGVVRDGTWEHEFRDAAAEVVVKNLADGKCAQVR